MRYVQKLLLSCAALSIMASAANATTRSSFLDVNSIAQVTPITSNAGLRYTVSLGATPSFTLGASTYAITDLIGFYVLSDDQDFALFSPLLTVNSPGPFSNDSSNSGAGAIAGWRSNPNNGILPGGSQVFTLSSGFPITDIDRIGFHVRVNGTFPGTTGNTGNITGLIPAPGMCTMLGLGGLVAARRRRS